MPDAMKVTKDRRGTYPRTVSYTVEDPDGYDYSVLILPEQGPTCFVHGKTCAHAKAVVEFIARGGKNA